MKREIRVLGIDDAPFSFEDERVEIVGAVVRLPSYLEGVLVSDVEVDGDDATDRVVEMVLGSRFREALVLIMVDGVAFGGFNVVDIEAIRARVGIPVITVTKKEPEMAAMEKALQAKFADWERRMEIIRRSVLERVETPHKPLYVHATGIPMEEVRAIIRRGTVRGALPEPLRLAHLIATAMKTGESRGTS